MTDALQGGEELKPQRGEWIEGFWGKMLYGVKNVVPSLISRIREPLDMLRQAQQPTHHGVKLMAATGQ